MRQDTSLSVYGTAGNNQAQNFAVATIAIPTPGRYRIWGMARHTLADGLKLTGPINLVLTSGPNDTAAFGPVVIDVNNAPINLVMQLNTATGAADTASCNMYAEKINH